MARYQRYDYAQTMLVAVSLEEQLQVGTLEHTIHYAVGRSPIHRDGLRVLRRTDGEPEAKARSFNDHIVAVLLCGYSSI